MSNLRKKININTAGTEIFTTTTPGNVQIHDGTNAVGVMMADGTYGLVTITPAHVSTDNSYSGAIASGGSFVGTAEEIINHGVISCIIKADQITTFTIEFSIDGTTWIDGDTYTIAINTAKVFSFQCAAKYFRATVTNGVVGVANVTMQIVLKPYYVKPSSHRIDDAISPDDDAELQKAVITGKRTDGLFDNVGITNGNNTISARHIIIHLSWSLPLNCLLIPKYFI